MKAAVLSNTRGFGLQGLLARQQRPFVIARRLSAHAQTSGELIEWVRHNGGTVEGVVVQKWDGEGEASGFGLKALEDCRAGSCLIALPARCHLTYDPSSTDPRLMSLINRVPGELWGAKLALQVLAHCLQGESSPFATYIANLPRGVPGLPMFFDGEALGAIQYPPVTEQVKRRCRWLLSFSSQALAEVRGSAQDPFEGVEVDANALGWALAVVTSRAFRPRGPSHPAAMLPLIDMANHSFTPNCKIAAAGGGGGGLVMVATRDVFAGEPLLLSYGALSNDFLLMDYGFVVPGNPFDTVQLRFDPGLVEAAKAVAGVKSAGESVAQWQQDALRGLGLAGEGANTEVSIRRTGASADQGTQPTAPPQTTTPAQTTSCTTSSTSTSTKAGEGQREPGAAARQAEYAGASPAVPAGAEGASAGGAVAGSRGVVGPAGCPVDDRLLGAVRVLCARNAGEVTGRGREAPLGDWDHPLPPAAEGGMGPLKLCAYETMLLSLLQAATLRTLSGLCMIALSQFSTTLAEDQAALAGAAGRGAQQPLPADVALAMQFRADKKQLLLGALRQLSARLKAVQDQGRDMATAAAPLPGSGPGGTGKAKSKAPAAKQGGKGFGR